MNEVLSLNYLYLIFNSIETSAIIIQNDYKKSNRMHRLQFMYSDASTCRAVTMHLLLL